MATDDVDSGGVDVSQDPIVIPTREWPWWAGGRVYGPSLDKRTHDKVQRLIDLCPRPVTQPEVDGLTEGVGQAEALINCMKIGIIVAGPFLAKRAGFRLPFKKLDPAMYNERAFPSIARPILVGERARRLWFFTRALAYVAVLWIPATMVFGSIGAMTVSKAVAVDPRLVNYRVAIMNQVAEGALSRDAGALSQNLQRMSNDDVRRQMDAAREKYERLQQQLEDGEGQFAKLHPEERNYIMEVNTERFETAQKVARKVLEARENPALQERQRVDYQALSDTDAHVPAPSTTNTLGLPRKSPSPSRPAPKETGKEWGDADAFADDRGSDLDDASPVGYSARQRDAAATGSAWDRVRRQAELGRSATDGNSDDNWGTSSEQKADSKAKRNAQQEFDELVDRERRG